MQNNHGDQFNLSKCGGGQKAQKGISAYKHCGGGGFHLKRLVVEEDKSCTTGIWKQQINSLQDNNLLTISVANMCLSCTLALFPHVKCHLLTRGM